MNNYIHNRCRPKLSEKWGQSPIGENIAYHPSPGRELSDPGEDLVIAIEAGIATNQAPVIGPTTGPNNGAKATIATTCPLSSGTQQSPTKPPPIWRGQPFRSNNFRSADVIFTDNTALPPMPARNRKARSWDSDCANPHPIFHAANSFQGCGWKYRSYYRDHIPRYHRFDNCRTRDRP